MQVKIPEELTKKIKTWFGRLKRGEKILLSFFIFVILFSFYFNKIIKPQIRNLSNLKSELGGLNRQVFNLKAQLPPLEEERSKLEALKKKNKKMQDRLLHLEKELAGFYRIPELLGKLAKQAEDLEIDFSYIRPKTATATPEGEYLRLDIEMQFSSPYADFQSYLKQLERLSAYLNITDIVIEEIKDSNFAGETTVTLVLSTLLTKDSAETKIVTKEEKEGLSTQKDISERNLFLPSPGVSGYASKSKYILSGITFSGSKSTAIINNEVYKTGDLLEQKYPIKQILPNMVIIKHGGQAEVLMLE